MLKDNTTVGQRFYRYRTEQGMSQISVSEGICSSTMVSLLENDKKIPSPKIMGKLADRLGVPLREIMGSDELGLEVDFQVDLLRVYTETGDFDHAFQIADELCQRSILLQHQEREILFYKVQCHIKTGNYRHAVDLLLPFLEQQETQQDIEDEIFCELYNKLGNAYLRMRDIEKAYSTYERAYQISLKLPSCLVSARVAYNLGLACNQLGLRADATRYLDKALAYYQKIEDFKSLADSYFAIAIANNSESHLVKALELYESLNAIRESFRARQYHAYHMEAKTNPQTRLTKLQKIADDLERVNDLSGCVFTLGRVVRVCLEINDVDTALSYIELCRSKLDLVDDQGVVADFFQVNALYYLALKNFTKSIEFAEKSCELFSIMGLITDYADSLEIKAEIYKRQGLFEEAYALQKEVSDTLRQRRGSNR